MKVKQFWGLHFYIEKKLFIWPSLRQQRAARQEECLAIAGAEISGYEVLIQTSIIARISFQLRVIADILSGCRLPNNQGASSFPGRH